jgi:hypothetical protein
MLLPVHWLVAAQPNVPALVGLLTSASERLTLEGASPMAAQLVCASVCEGQVGAHVAQPRVPGGRQLSGIRRSGAGRPRLGRIADARSMDLLHTRPPASENTCRTLFTPTLTIVRIKRTKWAPDRRLFLRFGNLRGRCACRPDQGTSAPSTSQAPDPLVRFWCFLFFRAFRGYPMETGLSAYPG